MKPLTAQRLAEGFAMAAAAGACAVVIAHLPMEDVPLARPILAPLASLATSYCPDRWDLFELKTAQEACIMVGNVQGGW